MSYTRLIVPDVHQKWQIVEQIAATFPEPKIYLGDWFDTHERHLQTANTVMQTIRVAKQEMEREDNIFLMGNHDWSYCPYRSADFWCSGFQSQTYHILSKPEEKSFWSRFQVSYRLGTTIFSHAGFNTNEDFQAATLTPRWCERVGQCRGGYEAYGGPLWLDFNEEFEGFSGALQFVGHTVQCDRNAKHTGGMTFGPPTVKQHGIGLDCALRYVARVTFEDDHALRSYEFIHLPSIGISFAD